MNLASAIICCGSWILHSDLTFVSHSFLRPNSKVSTYCPASVAAGIRAVSQQPEICLKPVGRQGLGWATTATAQSLDSQVYFGFQNASYAGGSPSCLRSGDTACTKAHSWIPRPLPHKPRTRGRPINLPIPRASCVLPAWLSAASNAFQQYPGAVLGSSVPFLPPTVPSCRAKGGSSSSQRGRQHCCWRSRACKTRENPPSVRLQPPSGSSPPVPRRRLREVALPQRPWR